VDIARSGHGCVVDRAAALADLPPLSVRTGDGWVAVRCGSASNDLNFVASHADRRVDLSDRRSTRGFVAFETPCRRHRLQ
jgi:hypothetical protein